jgi:hypothetical protein
MRTAQPEGPVPRPLTWLLVGHLAVAAGVVVLVVLLALSGPAHPADQLASRRGLDVLTSGYLFSGLGALGVAQILSIRRLLAHRRAVVGDPGRGFDATGLGARMERLEWSMGLALYPIVIGVSGLLVSSPPAPLLALYCALPCASPLLDQAYAGWAHRYLDGWGPRTLWLPPGGERMRRKLGGQPAFFIGLAVLSALYAAGSAAFALEGGVAPLVGLLAPVAAVAAAVPALLLVGPVRRLRGALRGYVVDVPELDAAARAMRRIAPSGALGAVLLAAAALTGSAGPLLAMAIALPLTFTLGFLSVNLSQALRIRLGVPLRDSVRRFGGARTR